MKFDSDSSIPRFHPREGACLLHGFDALSRHLPPSRDGDGLAQRQMQLLWGLGVALWGELVEGASESKSPSLSCFIFSLSPKILLIIFMQLVYTPYKLENSKSKYYLFIQTQLWQTRHLTCTASCDARR